MSEEDLKAKVSITQPAHRIREADVKARIWLNHGEGPIKGRGNIKGARVMVSAYPKWLAVGKRMCFQSHENGAFGLSNSYA